MKIFKLVLLAAAILIPAVAQEAKIVILEKQDTAALKTAYSDYKAAQERWEKAKTEIAKKYVSENGKVMSGWEKVDFSVDFRAMVPKTESSSYGRLWGGGLIPASSTYVMSNGTTSDLTASVDTDLVTTEGKAKK